VGTRECTEWRTRACEGIGIEMGAGEGRVGLASQIGPIGSTLNRRPCPDFDICFKRINCDYAPRPWCRFYVASWHFGNWESDATIATSIAQHPYEYTYEAHCRSWRCISASYTQLMCSSPRSQIMLRILLHILTFRILHDDVYWHIL
jgi:hypothetical protein